MFPAPEKLKQPPFHHEMILVEGGTFMMGSAHPGAGADEKPAHAVALGSFYLGKCPVTQAFWKAIMGEVPTETFFTGDDLPMGGVSWLDANDFIQKLNELTHQTYRLPSETEWEFAARGGILSKGCRFAGGHKIDAVAWSVTNSGIILHAVGGKVPNELGLHDMSGNLYEWCQDWYSETTYADGQPTGTRVDPQGPSQGNRRVLRGGSWNSVSWHCRSTCRHKWQPHVRAAGFGFRLALSLNQSP